MGFLFTMVVGIQLTISKAACIVPVTINRANKIEHTTNTFFFIEYHPLS